MFKKAPNNEANAMQTRTGMARGRKATLLTLCLVTAGSTAAARAHDHAGECAEHQQMSVMFEPGTFADDAGEDLPFKPNFVLSGGRWTTTATDGAFAQGESFTITYSFIPDGTSMTSTYATAGTTSNLFATMNAGFPGGMTAFRAVVADAFNRWGELTNINYVEVADDGAGWPASPGSLGARGDVRIGMHAIGEGPLAYNYYPNFGGDMALDSLDMASFSNPAGDFRSLRNTLTHEHGHGMGLAHIEPALGNNLMEPFLSVAYDGPQEDDIRGAQFLYGDWAESNDALVDAAFIGGPLNDPANAGTQVFTVDDVALERAGAADFYAFTAFALAPIAIRVEPVGSTYDFGPQGGQATTIDAKAVRNLGLRLWRRTSAANNTFSLLAQIDFNGAGLDEYHPPIPYTLAGFMVAEVYSNDNLNDSQRYRMTISNAAIDAQQGDAVMLVSRGLQTISQGDTVLFDAATIGENSSIALTVRNIGDGPLTLTDAPSMVGVHAADFTVGDINGEIAPDGVAILGITFAPTATEQRVAVLNLPNNDPNQPAFSFIIRGEGLPAEEEPEPEPEPEPTPQLDCNANGVEDAEDIATGASTDCDVNGTPDECEADTDGDGFIDACDNCAEIPNADQADSDGNGLGDACDEEEEQPCVPTGGPVCGEDGVTYANACAAELASVAVDYAGPCDLDEEPIDPEPADPDPVDPKPFIPEPHVSLCGAGSLAMVPLAMAGMCGMRIRRRGEWTF